MMAFVSVALAINGAALALSYFGRRFLLRLPMPGIWLLLIVLLAIVLTFYAAEATLS
ncbi:hypothetical protein [Stutzerimonas kunmingensis]|uniref:hypothetical protein n=1 Tax=Stutzerimonas kunmingensis TaxID=1211807 RepID=UPI0028AF3F4E|nr:hypothetical protein [Stutzerimonas kunmingensis]